MSRFGNAFVRSFLLLALPAWLFQRWLEMQGRSDVPGLWYTACCSTARAMLGALAWAFTVRIFTR